jgi:putative transposase
MFLGHRVDRSGVLLCVRWYVAYSLSGVEEMMAERDTAVDGAIVRRWTATLVLRRGSTSCPSTLILAE